MVVKAERKEDVFPILAARLEESNNGTGLNDVNAGCNADVSEIFTVVIFKAKRQTLGKGPWYPLDRREGGPHVFLGIRTSVVQLVARSQY
jgi:hypothetical protein